MNIRSRRRRNQIYPNSAQRECWPHFIWCFLSFGFIYVLHADGKLKQLLITAFCQLLAFYSYFIHILNLFRYKNDRHSRIVCLHLFPSLILIFKINIFLRSRQLGPRYCVCPRLTWFCPPHWHQRNTCLQRNSPHFVLFRIKISPIREISD